MNVYDRVRNIITEVLPTDRALVEINSSIRDDLSATSLEIVTLSLALEDEFGSTITDEDLSQLRTVGDIVDYIEARKISRA